MDLLSGLGESPAPLEIKTDSWLLELGAQCIGIWFIFSVIGVGDVP